MRTKITRVATALLAVFALSPFAAPAVVAQTETTQTSTTVEQTPTSAEPTPNTSEQTSTPQPQEATAEPAPPASTSEQGGAGFRRAIVFDQYEELTRRYGPSQFDPHASHSDIRAIFVHHYEEDRTALFFQVRTGGVPTRITVTAPRDFRPSTRGRFTHEGYYRLRVNGTDRNGVYQGTDLEASVDVNQRNNRITFRIINPSVTLDPHTIHRIDLVGDGEAYSGWGIDLNYKPVEGVTDDFPSWMPHSALNPEMPQRCGLDIALLFDLSQSVNYAKGLEPMSRAGIEVINGLKGTGSRVGIYNFASGANTRPAVSTPKLSIDDTNVPTLVNAINAIKQQENVWRTATGTNWEDGLKSIPLKRPGTNEGYDVVYILTDGMPTTNNNDYPSQGRVKDAGAITHQSDITRAVEAANRLKQSGTRIVPLMINVGNKPEWVAKDIFHTSAYYVNNPHVRSTYVPELGWRGFPYFVDGRSETQEFLNIREAVTSNPRYIKFYVQNENDYVFRDGSTYDYTNRHNVWRAGILTPNQMAESISSADAPVMVSDFNTLVESAKSTILDNCLGTITIKKRVFYPNGERMDISEGKGFSFQVKTEGLPRLKDPHDPTLFVSDATYTTFDDRAEVSVSIRSTDVRQNAARLSIYELVPDGFAVKPQEHDGELKNAVCEKIVNGASTPHDAKNIVDPLEKKNKGFQVIAGSDGFVVCTINNIRLRNLQPTIQTQASFDANRRNDVAYAPVAENQMVYDTVTINNIVPNTNYTLRSWLVDKETGTTLSANPTITTFNSESATFSNKRHDNNNFSVSGSLKVEVAGAHRIGVGKQAVVFNELYSHEVTPLGNAFDRDLHNQLPRDREHGVIIATHTNINDANQTVRVENRMIHIGVRKFDTRIARSASPINPNPAEWGFDVYEQLPTGQLAKIGPVDSILRENPRAMFSAATPIMEEKTYALVETKAPAGFELLAEPIYFRVSFTGAGVAQPRIVSSTNSGIAMVFNINKRDRIIIDVADVRTGTLPLTGGQGIYYTLLGGLIFIMLGAVYHLRCSRRR